MRGMYLPLDERNGIWPSKVSYTSLDMRLSWAGTSFPSPPYPFACSCACLTEVLVWWATLIILSLRNLFKWRGMSQLAHWQEENRHGLVRPSIQLRTQYATQYTTSILFSTSIWSPWPWEPWEGKYFFHVWIQICLQLASILPLLQVQSVHLVGFFNKGKNISKHEWVYLYVYSKAVFPQNITCRQDVPQLPVQKRLAGDHLVGVLLWIGMEKDLLPQPYSGLSSIKNI